MELFTLMSKYFWFVAILVTCANWFLFRKNSEKHISENQKLAEGYQSLLKGYLFWMNIPWIVMGFGCTVGGVPSVWYYFRPSDGNPFVLAWFASVFFLWIAGTIWLFFKNGAETLAKHPGAIEFWIGSKRKEITNPKMIKVFWSLCLLGGIFGVVMMLIKDIPLPDFR